MDLDNILKEFNNQNRDDLEIIKAVLPHCSKQICVSFALHCALDQKHLLTDERSFQALEAVQLFLKTGAKVSQGIVDSAANAAYAAANAAARGENDPNIYKDKMRSYLNKLKELISAEYSFDLSSDAAWLMAVVI